MGINISIIRAWLLKFTFTQISVNYFPLLKHLIIPYNPDYICDLVIEMSVMRIILTDEVILNLCQEKINSCLFMGFSPGFILK